MYKCYCLDVICLFCVNSKMNYLLIVQHNIGPPYVIGWDMQHLNTAIFFGLPTKFVIVPRLENRMKNKYIYDIIYEMTTFNAFKTMELNVLCFV